MTICVCAKSISQPDFTCNLLWFMNGLSSIGYANTLINANNVHKFLLDCTSKRFRCKKKIGFTFSFFFLLWKHRKISCDWISTSKFTFAEKVHWIVFDLLLLLPSAVCILSVGVVRWWRRRRRACVCIWIHDWKVINFVYYFFFQLIFLFECFVVE